MYILAKFVGKLAEVDRLTQSLVIDNSKIRKDLGWQPPYTMAQGLQATAEWYRQSAKSERV
jgi:UDP-glucose 4-epimerase